MEELRDKDLINSIVTNFIGGITVLEIDSVTRSIRPVYLNEGFYRMMGGSHAQTDALMHDIRLSVIPEDLPLLEQGIDDILDDNGSAECEFRIVDQDGGLMWLKLRGNLYTRTGSKNLVSAVILDCTEQKTIEEELKRQSDYMHLLMDTDITFDFNCRTDVCIYRFSEVDSLSHDSVVKGYLEQIPSSGIHKDDLEQYMNMLENAMHHARRDSMEFRSLGIIDAGDDYRWYKVDIVSILGHEGYVSHIIGHIMDIHEQKLKELELRLRADRDSLTGLMNKEATRSLIEKALEQYKGGSLTGALFMIDTDNFKNINDSYGHMAGDRVLATIGEILTNNFKGMDITGRIGGDEFMVFMNNIRSEEDAAALAKKLQRMLAEAFSGEAIGKDVSISIGIAVCPKHGLSFEELYQKADKALYFIKNNGKSGVKIYDE
ncbi:MAG: diguanylate cyclase [Lachnospiraceae bacterium]|nr:diguanylate cyclase [Lachnospiraceae bacterium]